MQLSSLSEEERDTETVTGGAGPVGTGDKIRVTQLQPGSPKPTLKLGGGEEGSRPESQREQGPADTLILDFWPPRL